MRRKGAGQSALFITVCCLLCLALLPSFPTIQILPFSLYHLSHTEVRMSMTQQGHCFVVLFYLFLDNEKSAEGLAWCLLPHIFTHETLPRPYGLSTGGYLTLLTLWHQKHRSWSLFFRGLSWIHNTNASWLKENNFFAVSPRGTLSSPCKCFYSNWQVAWLSKSSSSKESGEKASRTSDGGHGDMLWDLSCHNCPSSLWDTLSICGNPDFSLMCVQCVTSPKEETAPCD